MSFLERAGSHLLDDHAALREIYRLSDALNRAVTLDEIYDIALVGVMRATGASRAAILLFDESDAVRFKAWVHLSPEYRRTVDGHSPWKRHNANPVPVLVPDVRNDPSMDCYREAFEKENIRALAFIPISNSKELLGKFMLYYAEPHEFSDDQIQIAQTIANHVGFAVERKQAEENLRALNGDLEARVRQRTAELERANRELEAFSYSVSHDLRAPLRSIDGYSSLLRESARGRLSEDESAHVERVRSAVKQMSSLIDDLLSLSHVNRTSIARRSVDLTALANAQIERMRAGAPERVVECVVAPGLTAEMDPGLAPVLIDNLLDNAWKYTIGCPAARIEFGSLMSEHGERVYFVRDNGIGFDMQFVDKLFGAFQRLHADTQFAGQGIGLATAARVVRRHEGRIWAEGAPGNGATFYFTPGPQPGIRGATLQA